ncbi:glycosyltransferase [Listeria weihenstephanensis FSL R9-0317]|uniref:glycosyltransferase family 2 protein n=1 Tax=Listeria weihenstephanensis TaxID=1006155 RepID=UPI0003E87049|nr:glycosyltransferase [Listeria weihenstephanensis]EUJ40094.1 glycosyltransferase [Listeria weihenstephanensis FSL R9-0317]
MSPLVSVVIPTRNRVEMLERAIDSVLRQTYSNIEICVVIDGPDTVSKQLTRKYSQNDAPIRVLETAGVGGSAARNMGVQVARGSWIAFLDDDDEFLPTKIEKQLQLLAFDSEKRHLAFTSVSTYEPGKPQNEFDLPHVHWKDAGVSVGEYLFCRKGRKTMGFIQTSTLLIPRKLMLEIPFTDGLQKHQDWDLLLRMEAVGVLIKQVESAETVYHQHVAHAGRVGQSNVWLFSEEWVETMPVSQAARDSFALSIVSRGIATDKTRTKWQRQKDIIQRFSQTKWSAKYFGSYIYMLMMQSVRVYSN